jgi:hypothetical protein
LGGAKLRILDGYLKGYISLIKVCGSISGILLLTANFISPIAPENYFLVMDPEDKLPILNRNTCRCIHNPTIIRDSKEIFGGNLLSIQLVFN